MQTLTFRSLAQEQPIPDWVKNIGGTGESKVTGIAVDQANNVYVAGDFDGTLTVDWSGVSAARQLTSKGSYDIFIAKYTTDGRLLWAKGIGGNGWDQVNNIAVDNDGSVLMSGYFQSSVIDCDPGAGVDNFTNKGDADALVIKLNTDGDYAWTRSVSGAGADYGHQVYTDASGNVLFTGSFSGSISLPGGPLSSGGDQDAFIVKYDGDGNILWAYNMGGAGRDEFMNVRVNSNQEIFVIGYFSGDIDLNPKSPGTITTNTDRNYFLCKYQPDGALAWASKVDGGSSVLTSMAVGSPSTVYITGNYDGQIMFHAQTGSPLTANPGNRNLFVAKYDDTGRPIWISNIATGSSASNSYCIAADADNNIYMSGYFQTGLTFGSGANTKSLINNQGQDTYCAKLDASGDYVWAFNFGSTCSSNYGHKIAVDLEKHVLMGGMFCQTVDFNPGNCVQDLTAQHFIGDGYVSKYNQVNLSGNPGIISASLPQQTAPAIIDPNNKKVTFTVPAGTDLSKLKPKLTTDIGTLFPAPETEADLTNPKIYTLSSNCIDHLWTLSVQTDTHVITQAIAGPDAELCNAADYKLTANNPAPGETGTWSVVSPVGFQPFSTGNINDPAAAIANLPANEEIILKWTIEYVPDQSSSEATVKIWNYSKPLLSLPERENITAGQSLQIPASLSGIPDVTYTYLWSPASQIDNPSILTPNVNPLQTTVYHLTISYGASCTLEQDFTVIVSPSASLTACSGEPVSIPGDATAFIQPVYQWQELKSGQWTDIGGATRKDLDLQAPENNSAGILRSEYRRAVSLNTDSYYDSNYKLETRPKITDNIISTSGEIIFCNGKAENLNISGTPAIVPCGNFLWEESTDGTSWQLIPGSTGQDLSITELLQTSYFRRTISTGNCRSASNIITFTINAPATLANAGADMAVCSAGQITLGANLPGQGERGSWSVVSPSGYQPFNTENIHDPKATIENLPQNEEIRLNWAIENVNCNTSSNSEITIISYPDPGLRGPVALSMKPGDQISLGMAADLAPGLDYQIDWSPKKGLSNYNVLTPIASPDENTDYTVSISYGLNCVKTATVRVIVLKSIELPNSFSPNGDGVNDTWKIKGISNYPGSTVSVYNRYGMLLYQTTQDATAWDGTHKGKQMPAGVYYYIAIIKDDSRSVFKGIITILR